MFLKNAWYVAAWSHEIDASLKQTSHFGDLPIVDGFHECTDVIHAQPPVSAVFLEVSKLSESRLLVHSPTQQLFLSPPHHLSRTTPQPPRNLEHDSQGGHVLPTLHLAHVRAFDIGEVGQ